MRACSPATAPLCKARGEKGALGPAFRPECAFAGLIERRRHAGRAHRRPLYPELTAGGRVNPIAAPAPVI